MPKRKKKFQCSFNGNVKELEKEEKIKGREVERKKKKGRRRKYFHRSYLRSLMFGYPPLGALFILETCWQNHFTMVPHHHRNLFGPLPYTYIYKTFVSVECPTGIMPRLKGNPKISARVLTQQKGALLFPGLSGFSSLRVSDPFNLFFYFLFSGQRDTIDAS